MAEVDASSLLSKACFVFFGGAVMARSYARRTKERQERLSADGAHRLVNERVYVNSGDASAAVGLSMSSADALPQLIGKTPLVELKSLYLT